MRRWWGVSGLGAISAVLVLAACTAPVPSAEPSSASPNETVGAISPIGSSWVELPLQPPGGTGDLWVQGAYASSGNVVVTGQLAGPLAEQRQGGVRPVAWFSPDGSTWRPAAVNAFFTDGNALAAARFGSIFENDGKLGAFMTGSRNGIDPVTIVMQSTDGGQTWESVNGDVSLDTVVADVAPGGPGFVAVGSASDPVRPRADILVSTNGVDWTAEVEGLRTETGRPFGGFNAVASNGVVLVAAGSMGKELDDRRLGRVWTSPDGLSWTQQQPIDDDAELTDVVAYRDGFVMVGSVAGAPAAWRSTDGREWARTDLPALGGARHVASLATVGDALVATGDAIDHAVAWYSGDGQHWEPAGRLTSGAASARFVVAVEAGVLALGNSPKPAEPLAWLSPPSIAHSPKPAVSLPLESSPAPIIGETPGPDETPWPNALSLPGISLTDLARVAGTLGMTCQSGSGTIPDSSLTQWVLVCETNQRNTNLRLEVHYWNPETIGEVYVSAFPIDDSTPPDPYDDAVPPDSAWVEAVATAIVRLPYGGNLVGSFDPVAWIRANLYRAECLGTVSCVLDDGSVRIDLSLGRVGVIALRMDPSYMYR